MWAPKSHYNALLQFQKICRIWLKISFTIPLRGFSKSWLFPEKILKRRLKMNISFWLADFLGRRRHALFVHYCIKALSCVNLTWIHSSKFEIIQSHYNVKHKLNILRTTMTEIVWERESNPRVWWGTHGTCYYCPINYICVSVFIRVWCIASYIINVVVLYIYARRP